MSNQETLNGKIEYLSTEHDETVAVKQMWDAFPNYKKSVL